MLSEDKKTALFKKSCSETWLYKARHKGFHTPKLEHVKTLFLVGRGLID